jgi:transmembrane sensor
MLGLIWATYHWFGRQQIVAPTIAVVTESNPYKTELILDDGRVIALDERENGEVTAKSGVHIIKKEDGQIAYDVKGSKQSNPVFYSTVKTPRGKQYKITLPDGSLAELNANSSIRFPSAFKESDRTVEIEGEVFFDIKENSNQPFIVKTADQSIQVLGTQFNVNAYPDEKFMETTLLSGSVRVSILDYNYKLEPAQQTQFNKSTQLTKVLHNVDVDGIMAWKNGLFYSSSKDIYEIARQLERWYDVRIEIKRGKRSPTFTGSISKDLPLEKVLEIFELSDLKIIRVEKNITIVL